MRHLLWLFLVGVNIAYTSTKCTLTFSKNNGHISCSNIDFEEYLNSIFEIKANVITAMPHENVAKISIEIIDSHIPEVGEWLFLPWEDNFSVVNSITIVNSSVNTVKPVSKLISVESLNLSKNNISDYKFLSKMRRLKHLHLSHNNFSSDSYLFKYLQKDHTRLNLVNLSHSNLTEFGVITNLIDNYDLSFNPNLTLIEFNHTVGYRSPFLNFSGNANPVILKHLRAVKSFCLSIDLSRSKRAIESDLLKTIHIAEKILLHNNNIPILNENIFKISDLVSAKCPGRISIDLSNTNLNGISSNFFSSSTLDYLDLYNNNLTILNGSVFREADILTLNMSNSNISYISSSVFNYLTVKNLDLSKNNLSLLNGIFDYVESMLHLDLSNNPVETLNKDTFKNCVDLESLNLANVFVKILIENPFSNLISLRSLIMSFDNPINSTIIKSMHINELIITNTTLSKLMPEQFKGFYKLRRLTFTDSSISSIDNSAFKGLSNLRRINNLKDTGKYEIYAFQQLFSLENLDLSNHDLKKLSLELKELYSLKKLNLSINAITLVDVNSFATLKQLEILSLAENQLSTLEVGTFRHLSKLTHLYLNKNAFQQLAPGIFSGLDNLILLDVSNNDLLRTKPHLIFAVSIPKLKYLYLQGNAVGSEYAQGDNVLRRTEFTLIAEHISLEHIDINKNGWRCITLVDVLAAFKTKNISYTPTKPDYTTSNINGVSCT